MTTDGHRFLVDVGFLLALLGVAASALLNWFFAGLTFFGELPDRDDYRTMTLGFGLAALLLLTGLAPLWAARSAGWVGVVAVLLAALCGAAATSTWGQVASAPPAEYPEPWAAVQVLAWSPTSWPLLLLILGTPWLSRRRLRGRSFPTPR